MLAGEKRSKGRPRGKQNAEVLTATNGCAEISERQPVWATRLVPIMISQSSNIQCFDGKSWFRLSTRVPACVINCIVGWSDGHNLKNI